MHSSTNAVRALRPRLHLVNSNDMNLLKDKTQREKVFGNPKIPAETQYETLVNLRAGSRDGGDGMRSKLMLQNIYQRATYCIKNYTCHIIKHSLLKSAACNSVQSSLLPS